jgi:prepilin-type N-terminal cleavage/methylation domain-containing protein
MRNIIYKKNTGFTLIELLVSIALFSVVLTITLGSIMTIADSNKKARSLMSVTNNLNFAVDSMVRSFKTGDVGEYFVSSVSPGCFNTYEIIYADTNSGFNRRNVEYCFKDVGGKGKITKEISLNASDNNPPVDLTSSDVDIDVASFTDSSGGTGQPLLSIVLKGTVKISEKVSSSFSVQTAVSQRKLKI